MKIKMTLLLIVTAIATLSFTYVATQNEKPASAPSAQASHNEAVGGLVSEEN
ncbi:MAG TPA: hypothetical protein VGD65_13215 [Chryseosolibacter sp.]